MENRTFLKASETGTPPCHYYVRGGTMIVQHRRYPVARAAQAPCPSPQGPIHHRKHMSHEENEKGPDSTRGIGRSKET